MSQVFPATASPRISIRAIFAPLSLLVLFLALSFTERVQANDTLKLTFWVITAGFFAWYVLMLVNMVRNRYESGVTLRISKSHYVQMLMHLTRSDF